MRRAEILAQNPNWQLFRDGCPNGESPAQIAARADRVIELVRKIKGDTLIFSSGHFLRVFAARWLAQEIILGNLLLLDTASLSVLGYEHELSRPTISLWNSTCHLAD